MSESAGVPVALVGQNEADKTRFEFGYAEDDLPPGAIATSYCPEDCAAAGVTVAPNLMLENGEMVMPL